MTTTTGPRVVQVLEFAQARASELAALHALSQHPAVADRTDRKLETQKNARRRRANAFNSYKLPRRLRTKSSSSTSSVPPAPRCRKHRRRPHALLQARTHASGAMSPRSLWLPSHCWHAKRMIMTDQDGYMLAAHRADKSVAAALQSVRHNVLVHDTSYYGVVELVGAFHCLGTVIEHLVAPDETSACLDARVVAGQGEGAGMLYHPDAFPFGAIAPVTFIWKPADEEEDTRRHVWLWIHPAAFQEAMAAIETVCVQVRREAPIELYDRRGDFCRLKLRGRRADDVLRKILVEKREPHRVNATKPYEKRGQHAITSLCVHDPRLVRWTARSSDPVATDVSLLHEPSTAFVPTGEIRSPVSGSNLACPDADEPDTRAILKELEAFVTWTTTSAAAKAPWSCNHVRTASEKSSAPATRIDNEDEKLPCSGLWSSSKRLERQQTFRPDHHLNAKVFQTRQEGASGLASTALDLEAPSLDLVVITKHEPYPHTSGYDLVCLPCHVVGFLHALVAAGAFVVGLEEDAALCTVLHTPSFPRDYPDTRAGQRYWNRRAHELERAYKRKPTAKRVNYAKLGVASPFQPDWNVLFDTAHAEENPARNEEQPCVLRGATYMEPFSFARQHDDHTSVRTAFVRVAMPTLVCVHVIVPRRGHIDVNAMLLAPTRDDAQQFRTNKRWYGQEMARSKPTGEKDDERRLIGYVTSAIYDRPKGAVRALGFIACEALQHLFLAPSAAPDVQRKPGHYALALVRAPSSRMMRPVLVRAEP
ncbi:hypothetical protein PsorP6_014251 [Peronosclerospora sorghi]|uniref:Uncharacterized protein n=1 Tax=Peronosclerospora sorghi TaxID=230839 RepID=A0ACC0VJK3_9STRA|nr:hypothetical protein PsorP6_014251 [Peronosclerospora sorghi]